MGLLNFDARTVAPQVGLDPVPEGWYKTVVSKSNNQAAKSGNGGLLELILQIIEGPFQGRTAYWNLNLYNTSAQAVEIAYKQLSALCHVIGQYQVVDTNTPDMMVPALHNIPFLAHIVVAQGTNGPINNIKAVRDVNNNDPGKVGGATQQGPGPGQQMSPNAQPPVNQQPPAGWQGQPQTQPQGQWQPQPQTQPQGQPQQNWQPPANGGAPQGAPAWQGQPQGQPQTQPQGAPQGWQGPQGGQQMPPNNQPPPNQPSTAWQPPQGGGQQSAPWQR